MTIDTDVLIIGAGPGGCTAALTLSKAGIPCTIVDKAFFPRDKICGDAISGKSITVLNRIDPSIIDSLALSPAQLNCWGVKFIAPNQKSLVVSFKKNYDPKSDKPPGYVSKRLEFDNLLVEKVRAGSNINFIEGLQLNQFERVNGHFVSTDKSGEREIKSKLVIAADGAHSAFARRFVGQKMEPRHYAAGIRAYYRNVTGMEKDNIIELHFLKNFLPGYFWIFPLPNGEANVGAGMAADKMRKRKVDLKKEMLRLIETNPEISKRFENAELIDDIKGFGLPLGSKYRRISGDNYMLVGDAGYLVDPFTGEGIGNSIYSGFIAAEQAVKCLEKDDYSDEILKDYDKRVYRVMGPELKLSKKFQNMLKYPWLFNFFANRCERNENAADLLTAMFTDLDVRKQLRNPFFLLKLIFNQ